jgi:hypothetical protein
MSEASPSPPPPMPPPRDAGDGCVPILLMLLGGILLLPGLCSLGFMVAGGPSMARDREIILLWIACFAISALGIFLIRVGRRWRGRPTDQT